MFMILMICYDNIPQSCVSLRAAGCRLLAAGCRLPTADCGLRTANYTILFK